MAEVRESMAENKENRFKQWLEWLHHAYWIREFLGSIGLGAAIMTFLAKHFQEIAEYRWAIFCVMSAIFMYALAAIRTWRNKKGGATAASANSIPSQLTAKNNVPEAQTSQFQKSSNALTRAVPHAPGTFDSVEFFRTAYYSALQDVGANSFKAEAERVRPNDKESFYVDVLAVGSMGSIYDSIWWPLYRSQLDALLALNKANGMLPIDSFRKPYDEAKTEFAEKYAELDITFEAWIGFLEKNQLLIIHPSKMVEITLKGKDFLKYLVHWGRGLEAKRL
jgi:hypothetical protein